MNEQTIHSQDINVNGVFQSFYIVPDYQREYVWETEQVEQLLNDINTERSDDNHPENASGYFIGSIVVSQSEKNEEVLELIDGQQRMTTLFLTICAIRDRFKELEGNVPDWLSPMIAASSLDSAGRDNQRYRLDPQYEDSGKIIQCIAEGSFDEVNNTNTRSIENIQNAYKVILNFLNREFKNEAQNLRLFSHYLLNNVKLIHIQTEDVTKALKIFETINDRGVSLDSMDLLRNLLFMKTKRDEFDQLKNNGRICRT